MHTDLDEYKYTHRFPRPTCLSFCFALPLTYQPVRLWTGKQVIGCLLRPNQYSPVVMNLRARGKQYTTGEDLCCNDSCRTLLILSIINIHVCNLCSWPACVYWSVVLQLW